MPRPARLRNRLHHVSSVTRVRGQFGHQFAWSCCAVVLSARPATSLSIPWRGACWCKSQPLISKDTPGETSGSTIEMLRRAQQVQVGLERMNACCDKPLPSSRRCRKGRSSEHGNQHRNTDKELDFESGCKLPCALSGKSKSLDLRHLVATLQH